MAEIIDIVQNLQYRADVDSLSSATNELSKQLSAINTLQGRINNLESALNRTSINDINRRQRLTRIIDQNRAAIDRQTQSIFNQIQTNDRLSASMVRQSQALNVVGRATNTAQNATFALAQTLREAPAFAFSFQTGLLGISNNLPILADRFRALRTETGSTGTALSTLGKSLFSATNLLTIGISVLTIFGGQLFNTGKQADEATTKLNDFNKALSDTDEQARKQAANEISQLKILQETATNAANSQELRVAAAKKLLEIYPELNKQTDIEGILNGKAAFAINQVAGALVNKALAAAAGRKIDIITDRDLDLLFRQRKAVEDLAKAEQALVKERQIQPSVSLGGGGLGAINTGADRATKQRDEAQKVLEDIRNARIQLGLERNDLLNFQQDQQRIAASILGINSLIDTGKNTGSSKAVNATKDFKDLDERIKQVTFDIKEALKLIDEVEGRSPRPQPTTQADLDRALSEQRKNDGILTDDEKIARNQKRVTELKSAYSSLVSVIQTLNNLYAQQQRLLDIQYDNQQQRVQEASLLAQRGNLEIYNAEKQRLDAIAKEREANAQKQIQLNALLQASNAAVALSEAIGAVVGAAVKGDPYTIAARVAAAVAALVAGVASLKSAFSGFKDGVIDYKGKGTGTSDSNLVRISAGESVITAAATEKYKPFLESMNKGTFPIAGITMRGMNTKKLERKMDDVVYAIENNKVSVNTRIDESGVTQMIERFERNNRRRRR